MEAYQNTALSPEERAKDLLGRMTLKEKVGQLNQRLYGFRIYERQGEEFTLTDEFKEEVERMGGLGVLYGLYRADPWADKDEKTGIVPELSAKAYNMVQHYVMEHSRFGIPMMMSSECPHGHQALGGGLLPVNLAAGATFDPALLSEGYKACGKQLKSGHVELALMSALDMARDPRWGRSEECYSEDPCLAAAMAKAAVTGMQSTGVGSVAKHFCAQGETTGGVNASAARIGERELREIHFPSAKACCEAGVEGIMAAYNEIDGVYCHRNAWLLRDVLRGEMGFDGIVMADGLAVDFLKNTEGDTLHAAVAARKAGVDVSLWDEAFGRLGEAVDQGLLEESQIDEAVLRVLKLKFEKGLFEHPYIDENEAEKWNACSAHRKLALEAARRSIVLLKNENRVLPLSKQVKRIALIGQDAAQARLGGYSGPGVDKVSILDGLKNRLGDRAIIRYEEGCKRINPEYLTVPTYYLSTLDGLPGLEGRYFNNISYEGVPDLKRIDKRIQFSWTLFAPDSCLAVDWFSVEWNGKLKSPVSGTYRLGLEGNDGYQLTVDGKVLVDKPYKTSFGHTLVPFTFEKGKEYDIRIRFYENTKNARIRFVWDVDTKNEDQSIEQAVQAARESEIAIVVVGIEEGEFRDRGYLALPGRQEELIRRVAATGKTTVVVLIGGSAVVMSEWQDQVPAVLNAWYPGVEGGNAVADVLFGDYNPSGKLPITYPIHEAQLPLNYSHKPTGRSDDYLNLTGEPLFPFGHGLSYTTFEYGKAEIDKKVVQQGESLRVRIPVTNTGNRSGAEIVQLYVSDLKSSLPRPKKELKGFKKVDLQPGESQIVEFEIDESKLSYFDDKKHAWVAEPGKFEILIGASSSDIRSKVAFELE